MADFRLYKTPQPPLVGERVQVYPHMFNRPDIEFDNAGRAWITRTLYMTSPRKLWSVSEPSRPMPVTATVRVKGNAPEINMEDYIALHGRGMLPTLQGWSPMPTIPSPEPRIPQIQQYGIPPMFMDMMVDSELRRRVALVTTAVEDKITRDGYVSPVDTRVFLYDGHEHNLAACIIIGNPYAGIHAPLHDFQAGMQGFFAALDEMGKTSRIVADHMGEIIKHLPPEIFVIDSLPDYAPTVVDEMALEEYPPLHPPFFGDMMGDHIHPQTPANHQHLPLDDPVN